MTQEELSANPDDICIPGCTNGGDARVTKITRCLWCRKPHHTKCIKADVYICDGCRDMPQQVTHMAATINSLAQTVNTVLANNTALLETVQTVKQHQTDELSKASQQLDVLRTENCTLRQQIADMARENSSTTWQQFPKAHGTLLLGSSIVRDVDPDKLVSTKCISVSGGKIRDALSHLDSLPRTETYERIVLVTAGNDCDQDDSALEIKNLVDQYRDLVKAAKSHANKVTISSICPRDRSPDVSARITTMNGDLLDLSKELGVDFADSTPGFYLSDGSLNDGYLLDGVHLNPAGTNRLVNKLGLKLRPGLKSAHTNSRRRRRVSGENKSAPDNTPQGAHNQEPPRHQPTHTHAPMPWQKVEYRRRRPTYAHNQEPPRHQPTHTHAPMPSAPQPRRPQTNRYRGLPQNHSEHRQTHHTSRPTPLMDIHVPPPASGSYTATRPATTQRTYEDTRCQLCTGRGHSAAVCRSKTTTCYKCGVVGHYAHSCPTVHG